MRRGGIAIALGVLLVSCAGADAEESAILLLDEDARAAGIGLEVGGEAVEGGLPLAVPSDEEAFVVRPAGRERISMSPGEMIEVRGAEGEIARGPVDADRLVVSGTRESAATLAELLGGASVEALEGSRFALRAPGVTWIAAALYGSDRGPGDARAVSRFEHALAAGDGAWRDRGDAVFVADEDGTTGPSDLATPDAAALVGAYAHADVLFVLDAAGGFLLRTSEGTTRGTYVARPGGVEVRPAGGGAAWTMRLFGESLVDGVGLALAPARPAPVGRIVDLEGDWE
jgi:hypothetical protein